MKKHIRFSDEEQALLLLDQRYLPGEERWFVCRRVKDVVEALQSMVVRGAPAIGITAAYGCCLAAFTQQTDNEHWAEELHERLTKIELARPTAINLSYAVTMMRGIWESDPDLSLEDLQWLWLKTAKDFHAQDIAQNKAMGRLGMELLPDGATVMTHCNAGALATGGYGTALGVIRAAKGAGKRVQVIANETRPFLQGARLTAYELVQDGIPVRVACDNAAAWLMSRKEVDAVVVGADRIVANGDTANKIGTYGLALLAREHRIPFYVAAPWTTFDLDLDRGDKIPIEERPFQEVTQIGEVRLVPDEVAVLNYAFDVTPGELITAIITERGILRPPYKQSIKDAGKEDQV